MTPISVRVTILFAANMFLSACSPAIEDRLPGTWESTSITNSGKATMVLMLEPTGKYEMTSWVDCDDSTAAALREKADQMPEGSKLEGNRFHNPVEAGLWRLEGRTIVFEGMVGTKRAFHEERVLRCDEDSLEFGDDESDPYLILTRKRVEPLR